MICLPARLPRPVTACAAAALAAGTLAASAPLLAAQEQPGSYQLPPPSPTPTPRPAGPADERAGVAIPPRALPAPRAAPTVAASPSAAPSAGAVPAPRAQAPSGGPSTTARPPAVTPAASASAAPQAALLPSATMPADPSAVPSAGTPGDPLTSLPALPSEASGETASGAAPSASIVPDDIAAALPGWWPWAAGGAGGAIVLGILAMMLRRRRKPKVLRLAAPVAGHGAEGAAEAAPSAELPRLDLAVDVTGATRSLMMFTLHYRLAIANRTPRAANDLRLAVQIACARRGASNAASPGAAQALTQVERIGPHQSRTVTGTVQLPLAEIAVLRQGGRPLFIPLLHVTLEGQGQSALARSFVIGTPSASGAGRLHPILLEGPPGSIPDLRAQLVDIPAVPAAA